MRYYLRATDPKYVQAYKDLRGCAKERYLFFKALAQQWGFDEIGMHDFLPPEFFCKLAEDTKARKGAAIEGFTGGDAQYHGRKRYFVYTLHGRNKRATQLAKTFKDAPAQPSGVVDDRNFVRNPTIKALFISQLGLPNDVIIGSRVLHGDAKLLDGDVLVLDLPFTTDPAQPKTHAIVPDGFEEITARVYAAEIDKHNAAIEASEQMPSEG